MRFTLGVGGAVVLGFIVVSACTPPPPGAASPETVAGAGGNVTQPGKASAQARTRAPVATRPPPPKIATPMKGEPSAAALAEARLVPSTCDQASSEQVELRLKEMRAALAQSFKEWHDGQPECWAEDREATEMMKSQLENAYDASAGMGGGTRAYAPRPAASASPPSRPMMAPPKEAQRELRKEDSPGGDGAGEGKPAAAKKASGTNNQVAGVDEADIVKTDGRYVYLATSGALRILEAMKPRVLSTTRIGGAVKELFVDGDRAVVYASNGGAGGGSCTYAYDCQFGGDGSSTTISVYDIADRAHPKALRTIDLSGSLIAARRIGSAIHTVVSDGDVQSQAFETWPADLQMCGTMENVVRQKFAKLRLDNEKKIRAQVSWFPTIKDAAAGSPAPAAAKSMCGGSGLLRTAKRDGSAFTTVVSFDMNDDKAPPVTATLESRPGAVFASSDALYVSITHQKQDNVARGQRWYSFYPTVDEVSELHEFRIGERPSDTKYVGSGAVPGHVLNQFAMDEWYGYLRVATTKGRVPDPNVTSSISVFARTDGGNLARVGAVDGIAPGEDIRAVRFDGDRGYVVTFKKTDPLFVADLYQPTAPRILGELKIPGFSTYMHRIDPDHLLSIGFDANDHGDFAYFDGVILQLFDVKNPTDPRLLYKEKIGTRGSSSQAATDHLAFNYMPDAPAAAGGSAGLLAIPMTVCDGGGDGQNGDVVAFSGLLVYGVDVESGFKRLGGIDHHGSTKVSCGTWWSQATSEVKRSVFLDDLVYSIADDRVKVQRLGALGKDVADIATVAE